jgi:hypothetical protein
MRYLLCELSGIGNVFCSAWELTNGESGMCEQWCVQLRDHEYEYALDLMYPRKKKLNFWECGWVGGCWVVGGITGCLRKHKEPPFAPSLKLFKVVSPSFPLMTLGLFFYSADVRRLWRDTRSVYATLILTPSCMLLCYSVVQMPVLFFYLLSCAFDTRRYELRLCLHLYHLVFG